MEPLHIFWKVPCNPKSATSQEGCAICVDVNRLLEKISRGHVFLVPSSMQMGGRCLQGYPSKNGKHEGEVEFKKSGRKI